MFDKISAFACIGLLLMSVAIINVRNQREDYKRQLEAAQAHIVQLEEAAKMEAEYRAKAARLMEEMENENKKNRERAEKALSKNSEWADSLLPADVRGLFDTPTSADDVHAAGGTACPREDTVNKGTEH